MLPALLILPLAPVAIVFFACACGAREDAADQRGVRMFSRPDPSVSLNMARLDLAIRLAERRARREALSAAARRGAAVRQHRAYARDVLVRSAGL